MRLFGHSDDPAAVPAPQPLTRKADPRWEKQTATGATGGGGRELPSG